MSVVISKADVKGYRQVEPNHLSAPRDGRIYAQLPANDSIEVLENGTFVKYDQAAGEINFTGKGPWMMVFNEEKKYDERKQMHRDYAMTKADAYRGVMVPRVFGMVAGDIFTTNNLADGTYNVGDLLKPGDSDGVLAAGGEEGNGLCVEVIKETTMPDMQPAVKVRVLSA